MTSTADLWKQIQIEIAPVLKKNKDQFDKLSKSLAQTSNVSGVHENGGLILAQSMDHRKIQDDIPQSIEDWKESCDETYKELKATIKRHVDENKIKNNFR